MDEIRNAHTNERPAIEGAVGPTSLDLHHCHALAPVPTYQLDLSALPASEQLEFWQGAAPDQYAVRSSGHDATPLGLAWTVWQLDSLLVTRFRSRAHFISRTVPAARSGGGRFLKVRLYNAGGAYLFDGDGITHLDTGSVYLIDQSRAWSSRTLDHEHITVFIPHWAIGYDPARYPVCHGFDLHAPEGRILANALRTLVAEMPNVTQEAAPFVGGGFTGLVEGLLGRGLSSSSQAVIRTARAKAMRDYLERHLHNSTLGSDELSQAFGAARATIYRDFAEDGGVARYILRRRLQRAFDDLADHAGRRGLVQATAEQWGFASVSHFSEAFVGQFGVRPSEVIGLRIPQVRAPPECRGDREATSATPSLAAVQARLTELYARFTA